MCISLLQLDWVWHTMNKASCELRRRMAIFIQCCYRRRHAKRMAAATKLQAALRMRRARRSLQSMRSSALIIQVHSAP